MIDNTTGRPLAGARVLVFASNGTPLPEPLPEQVTAEDGRFRLPVPAGTHDLTIVRPGYTPAFRIVTTGAGQGTDVFDPRLTPSAKPRTLGAAGGVVGSASDGEAVLTLPAGALAAPVAVAATRLDEQGLPALLPYGWSPRAAVWLDLGGAALLAESTLSLPSDAPSGTTLTLVHLDLAALQWRVLGSAPVAGGRVEIDLPVAAAGLTDGGYAAVQADTGALAPPAPVAGAVLGGSAHPAGDEPTAATMSFNPEVVLPSQSSLATAVYTLSEPAASGLPLTLLIEEELTLLDNSVRRQTPYQADLILYHAPDGTPRSRFQLRPSASAQTLPLKLGAEDVTLRTYGGEAVSGNVVGPEGGTVTGADGDRIDLPAGAVTEPTAIVLTRKAASDLGLPVPAGTALDGVIGLDLNGQRLLVPGALSLALSPAPAAGDKGLLLQVIELESGRAFRAVAALQATATGWTTAPIDPQDLPWPGVREEGLYAFVRLTGAFGYLRGTVSDVGGLPLAGAVVRATGVTWVQLSNPGGTYALPVAAGTVTATAENRLTGNQGSAQAEVVADARVDLNLSLQPVGPRVVQITPADGALDVVQGIQPTVRFSEPVAPASVTGAIQLLSEGQPVAVDLEVQGALVRVKPRSALLPATQHELRVTSGVRDLQGNSLESPEASQFTTLRVLLTNDIDLTRVFLVEPGANGQARVLGKPGAVPAGALVFVENRNALVTTPSATAGQDGGFDINIEATFAHTLILHVLIPGSNEIVSKLTPFHTPDLKGAYVDDKASTFTTGDGLTVKVPAGAFQGPTIVRAAPLAVTTSPVLARDAFAPVAAFTLDFSGAEAFKALQVSVPLPAGAPTPVGGFYLLNRVVEALGDRYWMMHDLMRLDAGRLTTEEAPASAAAAPLGIREAAVVASLGPPFALAQASGPQVYAASSIVPRHKQYVPGASFPGQYQIEAPLIPLGFTVFPSFDMNVLVGSWNRGLEGIFTSMNAKIASLLEYDGILIPARLDRPLHLVVRDLSTGFRLFDGTFAPPTGLEPVLLPADAFGDRKPPFPTSGSPLRFFPLNLGAGDEQELDLGIEMNLTEESPTHRTLTVQGDAGSASPDAKVYLIGLDDEVKAEVTADGGGAFSIARSAEVGHRYLLAIGGRLATAQPIDLSFSESLGGGFSGIEVLDAQNRKLAPQIEPLGSRETVRIRPSTGWRAGETYTLRLGPALADEGGNAWGKTLDVKFKVIGSDNLGTYQISTVRDVARLGSLLFVAADMDGLVVLDASDPSHVQNLVAGDVKFPFPYNDPVRGVAVDPHGRVLVVGGGVTGFGQLKIFDPLALDTLAVASHPEDPAVRYAAFQGSTILSDKLGGPGTQLPSGTPRRVAVLSNDQKDEWRLGEAPPAGLQVVITQDPQSDNATVVVTGQGKPKHPVSLFDLTQGTWLRVDAADADGHFEISMDVLRGDRLRLLRNQRTLAYVVTQGVGLEVVDVDAFYHEDRAPSPIASDVVGIYNGFNDPELVLCGQHEADLSTAMLDLDTLFDTGSLHPMSILGLVGNKGLVVLESQPAAAGQVSFVNEACADAESSRAVTGLEVLQGYRFDLDGDGKLESSEERDYALVSHRAAGVLIFDVTDRDEIVLAGKIKLPGNAAHLSVDREHRRVFVAGFAGGLYVVDLDRKPRLDFLDVNKDNIDDRVLETVTLLGNTNAAPLLIPELGIALAGGLQHGVTSLNVGEPLVQALARKANGEFRVIERLAPFGVPTAKESSDPEALDLPGSFFIQAHLPGVTGQEVRLDLVSHGPGGKEIDGLGDPETLDGLPRTSLKGTDDSIVLKRLSANPFDDGYTVFRSKEIAAIADVRAAKAYTRTQKEKDDCTRCDLPEGEPLEILSGDAIAVRFPDALRLKLKDTYSADRLNQAEIKVASVRWEVVPALKQEPALSPSLGHGDAMPGTLLHSGEMSLQQTDLHLKSRGFDLAFTRTYRNQTVGAGPLGPGWDFAYRQRLRELPNGDVEYFDGRGRRERFTKQQDKTLKAPKGVFVTLERTAAGWVLIDPRHNLYRFDRYGRLAQVNDAVKDSADTGNEMLFGYDLSSRLVRITDSLERHTLLEYDEEDGRLKRIEDPTGREVKLEYDDDGRLQTVKSPKVETGESKFLEGLTTRYVYESASGALAATLNRRDNLASVTDPREKKWLELVYTDANSDGRPEEVTSQTLGDGTVHLSYSESRETTVTDRRGNDTKYQHDEAGHATRMEDPSGAVASYQYNDEGLVTLTTTPTGRTASYTYDQSDKRRSRGNVTELKVTPGSGGPNGSAGTLTTTITYETRSNQPTRIVDSRGTATEITRDSLGQPTSIVKASGTDEASTTQISYNAFGQPERVTNANGHVTAYRYFMSEEKKGYLESVTTDDGGLDLTTRFEVDDRGNPTTVTDARGLQHEREWNEVDWLVEATEPLGARVTYLYDAAGNVTEQRLPVHDGQQTAVRTTYGTLGEVLSVEREVESGSAVTEQLTYDAGLNLTRRTAPEGQATEWTYDERNLPVQVVMGSNIATVTAEYDAEGRRTQYTDGRGAVWTTEYDGYGRVKESADPLGNKSQITYDDGGNPVDRKGFDSQQLLAEEAAVFDRLNRPTVQRSKLWGGPDGAQDLETRIVYDPLGNVIQQMDPLGRVSQMSYDGAERLVSSVDPAGNATELDLDSLGNVLTATTQERNPQGGSVTVQTSATYDDLNRPVTMTDPQGNSRQAVYDVRGNVKLATDPEGNTTENTYDGLDRLIKTLQPEGISITYEYDGSSRLTSYKDALGNTTRWAYDALDRRLSTTYPDNTAYTYDYDDAGNLVGWTDPRGTHVTQTFDLAGRLEARSVSAAAGVIGPLAESYEFDGLGRLTRAQSGDVIVERDYDSLSRLLSETTNGKTITHGFDKADNPTTIGYPSGHAVNQTFDALDLPKTISASGAGSGTLATYGWRGAGLPVQKSLGNGVSGSAEFDLAGRLTSQAFSNPQGTAVFQESLGWSPRNLKVSQSRGDQNGAGFLLEYDKAGRVTEAARSTAPVATPNNTKPDPLAVAGLSNSFNFKYDAAQNLVERRTENDKIFATEPMPLDGSGRNRPASINGIQLEWDANGNLTRKGSFKFLYDYRNRLTRVTDLADNTFATYVYDAFNRRISKTVGGDVQVVVWDGWQAIEEYKGGQLASRRTFGAGLDEMVQVEKDLDGNGSLEQKYVPLYDDSGNLVTMTGVDGKPIERYVYSPYGEQTILVDSTAPAVEQVRAKGGAIWVEVSEEVLNGTLAKAVADHTLIVTDLGTQQPLPIQVTQPVMTGRQARRRIAISTTTPPAAGTQVKLTVPPEALQDLFLNRPQQAYELTFAWPAADAVLFDDKPVRIDRVAIHQGVLEIGLTEEADPATTSAIQIDGAAATWTLSEDRYTLKAGSTLAAGSHTLTIGTGFADLDGNALAEAYTKTFSAGNQATLALFEAPDARKTPVSTIGNPFSFQGHPRDLETGLVYMRNRYYDPQLGRFITPDPLGYVDGPNTYGFAGNDPVNGSDPMGLRAATEEDRKFLQQLARAEGQLRKEYAASGSYQGKKITQEQYDHGLLDVQSMQRSYIDAVADVEEGQPIRAFAKPVDFFDNRQVTVFRAVPTRGRWERETRANSEILFWTIEGPNLALSLLAPVAAMRMARQPSRGAVRVSEGVDKGLDGARAQGVRQFWKQERGRLRSGQPGTRNWTPQQERDILAGRTPVDPNTGQPIQGHHKYSVKAYPEQAADGANIHPVTSREHLEKWHGGKTQNDTHGQPLKPQVPDDF
ncbi:MAG TPA: Ig-like domain-containing protein [Thermoanaerobaculia bacterium]|nr:Ig-like domain-containing protein [Thermoanaerobaculia bacterium]